MYTLLGKSQDSPGISPTWMLGHVHSNKEILGLSWDISGFVIWTLGHIRSNREVLGLSWSIPNYVTRTSQDAPGMSMDTLTNPYGHSGTLLECLL